jgi:ATP-binding protein involved in chromosome partitioning
MVTKDLVLHVLSGINDPELKKPLTDLDMVRFVDVKEGDVTVGISLTVPGCPLKAQISNDITRGVGLIPGVSSVQVEFDVMSDAQRAMLAQKLGRTQAQASAGRSSVTIQNFAKRFIAVSSGKGGVGKSTITTNLAAALARRGPMVGVLDADVYGFSIPRMMGVSGQPAVIDDKIVPLKKGQNIQVVSMGFFVREDEPVIWRGPLLHKAINQFLSDVLWDELDYLFLDLPPGTGDVTITIATAIPSAELLVITTPQPSAYQVAGRVAKLAERTKLRVIGVIENMSWYESNGKKEYLFGKDGGKILADALKVPLLAQIPLNPTIREGADSGNPVAFDGTPEQIEIFQRLAEQLENMDS